MSLFEIIKSVSWEPYVGDPTALGWLTVAAYLLAAVLCGLCAWRAAQIFGEEAVWLHAIDAFLYSSIAGILPNWLLELGGIVLVAVPALGKLMKDEG